MTNIFRCPKGHKSTKSDFCSECGTKIQGIAELMELAKNAIACNLQDSTNSGTPKPTTAPENCPDCSTPRKLETDEFCEICGYNFVSGLSGEVAITAIHPYIQKPGETEAVEIANREAELEKSSIVGWKLIITIDPLPRHSQSPKPPTNQPPITFKLEKATNLIGRNSKARAVYPEIPLDFDAAVSQRHALINRQANGTLILRDIGSSNGTQFKGVELKPMVDIILKDGDEFTLGHWTRITVQAIFQSSNSES